MLQPHAFWSGDVITITFFSPLFTLYSLSFTFFFFILQFSKALSSFQPSVHLLAREDKRLKPLKPLLLLFFDPNLIEKQRAISSAPKQKSNSFFQSTNNNSKRANLLFLLASFFLTTCAHHHHYPATPHSARHRPTPHIRAASISTSSSLIPSLFKRAFFFLPE